MSSTDSPSLDGPGGLADDEQLLGGPDMTDAPEAEARDRPCRSQLHPCGRGAFRPEGTQAQPHHPAQTHLVVRARVRPGRHRPHRGQLLHGPQQSEHRSRKGPSGRRAAVRSRPAGPRVRPRRPRHRSPGRNRWTGTSPSTGYPLPRLIDKAQTELRTEALRQLWIRSLIALAIMLVIVFGLSWFVAGRMLRPLHAITSTARRLSGSTLHERINLKGHGMN